MARTDIATLAVKLVGDSTMLDKEVARASKMLTGFANSFTSPLNSIRGLSQGITGAFSSPMNALVTDATRFTSMIPGFSAISAALAHPIHAAEKSMERLDKLGEDASRIGIDPQFLRGLQIAAEAEAGAIQGVMSKALKFQGQLKAGSTDLMNAGGRSAMKVAKDRGLDVQAWINANPEELFQLLAKAVQKAAESGEEFAFVAELGMKAGAGFMNTFKNAGSVDEYTQKVRAASVATKAAVALATEWDDLKKDLGLHNEAAQEKMLFSGGLMGMGWDQLATGNVGKGLSNMLQGGENWIRTAFGGEGELPQDMAKNLVDNVYKSLGDAYAKGAGGGEIGGMVKEMDAIMKALHDLGEGYRINVGLAEKMAGFAQRAKQLIPKKGSGMSAEDEAAWATADAPLIEQVLEPMADSQIAAIQAMQKAMRSPMEKLEDELYDLDEMRRSGMFGDETYERALRRMKKQAAGPERIGAKEAGADMAGSQEWAKAFNRLSGGEAEDDEQLEELKRQTEVERRIEDAILKLNDAKPKVLQAPP